MIIEKLFQAATYFPFGSLEMDVICNILITLSYSESPKIVDELFVKLRRSIAAYSSISNDQLIWKQICTGTRFILFLSFQEFHCQVYLPEILYLISSIIPYCQPVIRQTLFALMVNAINRTIYHPNMSLVHQSELENIFLKLTNSRVNNFGLDGFNNIDSGWEKSIGLLEDNPGTLTMEIDLFKEILKLNCLLVEFVKLAAKNLDIQTWPELLLEYSLEGTSSKMNLFRIPSFLTVAHLIDVSKLDKESKKQPLSSYNAILDSCIKSLTINFENFEESNITLISSILMCLTACLSRSREKNKLAGRMFWFAMAILQLGHTSLFQSGLLLIRSSVDQFYESGHYDGISFCEFLLEERDSLEYNHWVKGENNYKEYFSLSIVGVLLPALYDEQVRVQTLNEISNLFLMGSKSKHLWKDQAHYQMYMLGYIITLLTTNPSIYQLLENVSDNLVRKDDDSCYSILLDLILLQKPDYIITHLCLIYRLLKYKDAEGNDRLYRLLMMLVEARPQLFLPLY
jgi:hypothetical protein